MTAQTEEANRAEHPLGEVVASILASAEAAVVLDESERLGQQAAVDHARGVGAMMQGSEELKALFTSANGEQATIESVALAKAVAEQLNKATAASNRGAIPDLRILVEQRRQEARDTAQQTLLEAESAVMADRLPAPRSLRESLDDPLAVAEARFDGLCDRGDRMVVVGQRKAGKTSLMLGIIHSLLAGEPFLDGDGFGYVGAPCRAVMVLNFEMSEPKWVDWARDVGLDAPGIAERLTVWHLRGAPNPLAFEGGREALRAALEDSGAEVLVLDTMARAFHGLGDSESDNVQGQAWAQIVDEIAGDRDVWVTAHTSVADDGRARGGSWLEGWVDNLLILQREGEQRFLSGRGRARSAAGVDLEDALEGGLPLEFDSESRRMVFEASSERLRSKRARGGADERKQAKAEAEAEQWRHNQRVLLGAIRDLGTDTGHRDLMAAMSDSKATPRAEGSWVGGVDRNVRSMLDALRLGGLVVADPPEPARGVKQEHSLTASGEAVLEV